MHRWEELLHFGVFFVFVDWDQFDGLLLFPLGNTATQGLRKPTGLDHTVIVPIWVQVWLETLGVSQNGLLVVGLVEHLFDEVWRLKWSFPDLFHDVTVVGLDLGDRAGLDGG